VSQYENVSVVKAANIYFDGKVSSRTVILADGSKVTLGIMLPGDYEFGTAEKEIVEVLTGDLQVLLPNESEWRTLASGDIFEIPADSKFQLQVASTTDYVCSYIS
jgi:hypothetical protein